MTSMTGILAKFRALSKTHQRIVLNAAFLLPFFWIGLHFIGLRRLQAWLQHTPAPSDMQVSLDDVMTIGNLVNIAGRHAPCPVTCLTRSLLLDWTLRRRGVASQLRIGVRLTEGVLDAHAWVEVAGVPVNDRSDVSEQFAQFADVPPPGSFLSP